jgi:hypothetical protein
VGWDVDNDRASYSDHALPSHGRSSINKILYPHTTRPVTVQEDVKLVHCLLSGSSSAIRTLASCARK